MLHTISLKLKHFFHVVSNVRPTVRICTYILLTPVFALVYWALPDAQFRIPDGSATDFGSWLYYSIVTITTLGFGDYTPAYGWAQAVTAIEVICGLSLFGFFLNSVGSMKSEIDVYSEIEKQKLAHAHLQKEKLILCALAIIHNVNVFLSYCYAVTTPWRAAPKMRPLQSGFQIPGHGRPLQTLSLSIDNTRLPAVARLLKSAAHTSLSLDSLRTRVDMTLWLTSLKTASPSWPTIRCSHQKTPSPIPLSHSSLIPTPPRRNRPRAKSPPT